MATDPRKISQLTNSADNKPDLRPVSASGQSFTDDDGKFRGFGKSAGAMIKGGLGFKR